VVYDPDPSEFMRLNYHELFRFSGYILGRMNFRASADDLTGALHNWYLYRLKYSLRSYNPAKGTIETWIRINLRQALLNYLNERHHINTQSLDAPVSCHEMTELSDVLGMSDDAYEEAELRHDIKKFFEWASNGNVMSYPSKMRVVQALRGHTRQELPSVLGVTKQNISLNLRGIIRDYERFKADFM
jgi:hypothetical protein